jgi:3-oxoacyl-[acyl-carrier protein] reductase
MSDGKKLALVTGASRGIGKAIALTLASDGYSIIVHYNNNQEKAEEVVNEIKQKGVDAFSIQGNLSIPEQIEKMFRDINEKTEVLDLLVNNAGMDHAKMIEDYSIKEMKEVIDSNLTGTMIVTKIALPFLKKSKKASIINISSRMGGPKTIETIGAYGPAKAGVIKFTQCCALEFAPYKIRVNCVAPGLTYTDMNIDFFLMRAGGDKVQAEKDWEEMAKKNPSGRVGQPQDIANVVSFLASEKSEYINSETIGVNGGSNLI